MVEQNAAKSVRVEFEYFNSETDESFQLGT
jgi:hypothetical protein